MNLDEQREPPVGGQAHPLPPFHTRLIQTFVAPGKLAEALAHTPAWALALVVGALLVVAQTVLIPPEVWDAMFRETLLQQSREMPEGFDAGGTIMRVSAVVGGTVMYFVMTFLFAGIVTLIFAFLLGDEGRYKQYLASLAHAWLIPGLVGLALVPLRISEQNPQLTLNLGTFFYFLPDGYLQKVFTMLDLSQIWAWLVVAQGAHAIDGRRSVGSAGALLITLSVVMAMIFALFVPTL
jgi:hypothetical protein